MRPYVEGLSTADAVRPSILLVDDHEPNLVALEALLQPLALKTVRAGSGSEALDKLAGDDFAAVLLDVRMPGMDGFETAAFIRQTPRAREVPLIFVTAGESSLDDTQRGYAHGAVDYLTKPLDPDALRSKIAALVELWRRGESIRVREMAVYEQERAALQSAVRQTEAELRLIIDGVRDHAISLLDPEGRVRTFNAPAQRIKGYRLVTTAATAADAFELFQERPPDLLVSDIGMKGNDGYWLIRQIRQLPEDRGGRTPAVAVTAYAATRDRTRALLEGFTNHVSKPTEPQELLAVIAASAGRTSLPKGPKP